MSYRERDSESSSHPSNWLPPPPPTSILNVRNCSKWFCSTKFSNLLNDKMEMNVWGTYNRATEMCLPFRWQPHPIKGSHFRSLIPLDFVLQRFDYQITPANRVSWRNILASNFSSVGNQEFEQRCSSVNGYYLAYYAFWLIVFCRQIAANSVKSHGSCRVRAFRPINYFGL
jgi:hypothetical protein